MSRKTTASYAAAFKYIDENIFKLRPTSFMTDYERAMRNGLTAVYPEAKMRACWFHFTQALRRYAAKIPNFFKELAKDKKLNKIYHKFLALPLLPDNEIKNAYSMLKMTIQCLSKTDIFQPFLDYFERQWLLNVSLKKEISACGPTIKLCARGCWHVYLYLQTLGHSNGQNSNIN